MIDFSISLPRAGAIGAPRETSRTVAAPVEDAATIELRTTNVRGAYAAIVAAEDDGLPIDVCERGAFLDTRLTITLRRSPSERDRTRFVRLSEQLARFGPIALKPA